MDVSSLLVEVYVVVKRSESNGGAVVLQMLVKDLLGRGRVSYKVECTLWNEKL